MHTAWVRREAGVHSAGRVSVILSIELLPAIIAIEGVGDVVEVHKGRPAGSNLHVGPACGGRILG